MVFNILGLLNYIVNGFIFIFVPSTLFIANQTNCSVIVYLQLVISAIFRSSLILFLMIRLHWISNGRAAEKRICIVLYAINLIFYVSIIF